MSKIIFDLVILLILMSALPAFATVASSPDPAQQLPHDQAVTEGGLPQRFVNPAKPSEVLRGNCPDCQKFSGNLNGPTRGATSNNGPGGEH